MIWETETQHGIPGSLTVDVEIGPINDQRCIFHTVAFSLTMLALLFAILIKSHNRVIQTLHALRTIEP